MRSRSPVLPALAGAALALTGCGGASDEQLVRDTLKRYETATARHDYDALCAKVLATSLIRRLNSVGLPCPQALRIGLGGTAHPRLKVLRVKVTGSKALAVVRSTAAGQPTSTDTVQLVRDRGAWRISSLAGEGPPAPRRAPAD